MISVCIPVYNFDVTQLVCELYRQGRSLGIPLEIVLIDDGSSEEFRILNRETFKDHKSLLLPENVGRSRIRNLFADHTIHNKLLFLDCDSAVISDNFLSNYLKAMNTCDSDVICGGSIYQKDPPERGKRLRWKYGTQKESRPAKIRKESPGKYFMGNNFMIDRKIFDSVRFDERISEYGYEDTLFAWQLLGNGVGICHIDNPVLNSYLDDNSVFLDKTEKALENLVNILSFTGYDKTFISNITILDLCSRIKRSGLRGILFPVFRLMAPVFKTILLRGYTNLRIFDLFRLGLLVSKKGLRLK